MSCLAHKAPFTYGNQYTLHECGTIGVKSFKVFSFIFLLLMSDCRRRSLHRIRSDNQIRTYAKGKRYINYSSNNKKDRRGLLDD